MGKRGHGYGSEDHLRNYLDRESGVLEGMIAAKLGIPADAISWLPYPRSETGAECEYQGLGFLPRDQTALREAWRDFWPTRGRQQTWDAVGTAAGAWLLVEAKANAPEFCSPPTTSTGAGRDKIEHALNKVKRDLDVHRFYTWTGSYYQYANRLAMLWFLRKHDVEARLLFIYFPGDEFPDATLCPGSPEEWEALIEARRLTLGLPKQHKLSQYECHLFLRAPSKEVRRPGWAGAST